MNALPVSALAVVNGVVKTNSQTVAEVFGKRHDHVLRDIRALITEVPPEYLPNFGEVLTEYQNGMGGIQKSPAYELTRDGFTLLAMGFTGSSAIAFKVAYIAAFNRMEAELRGAPEKATTPAMLPGSQLPYGQVIASERDVQQVLNAANRLTEQYDRIMSSMKYLQNDLAELQSPVTRLAHAVKFRHLEPNVTRAEIIRVLSKAGKDGLSWVRLISSSKFLKGAKTPDVLTQMIADGEIARLVLPRSVTLYLRQFAPVTEVKALAAR